MLQQIKNMKEESQKMRKIYIDQTKSTFRTDGFEAEPLIAKILPTWIRNNVGDKMATDFKVEGLGLVDLKTGLAKDNNNHFCLEVIQNPNTSVKDNNILSGISDWVKGSVDYLAYWDLSDEENKLYLFDCNTLRKTYKTSEIVTQINMPLMKYYAEHWAKGNHLPVPRKVEDVEPLMCFGNSAMGFRFPTSLASGVIVLNNYIKEQDARNTNSTGTNRTYKKKTNPMLYPAKALYDSSIGK